MAVVSRIKPNRRSAMSSSAASLPAAPWRDWEAWLKTASRPASPTEEAERDRTLDRIRDAIVRAPDIPSDVRIYVKGSYANNTNVRRDADVDIAVEWNNTIKVATNAKAVGLSAAQLGYTPVTEPVTPALFRGRIERALTNVFGETIVDTTPDKHIGVRASTGTLDGDVVPCFALDRYDEPYHYHRGHRIYPKSGGKPVDNFPKQNYDNGVAKNNATKRRYKELVRCTKRIISEVHEAKQIPRDYPGYLTECLLYNVPNTCYGHARRYEDLQAIFRYLWGNLDKPSVYNSWTETSGLKWLFRDRADRRPDNARIIVGTCWLWIGGPNA